MFFKHSPKGTEHRAMHSTVRAAQVITLFKGNYYTTRSNKLNEKPMEHKNSAIMKY